MPISTLLVLGCNSSYAGAVIIRGVPQRFVGRHTVGPVVGSAECSFSEPLPCRGMCKFFVCANGEFPLK
jgi:hypothetical protein